MSKLENRGREGRRGSVNSVNTEGCDIKQREYSGSVIRDLIWRGGGRVGWLVIGENKAGPRDSEAGIPFQLAGARFLIEILN